jgi:hypothetical protein
MQIHLEPGDYLAANVLHARKTYVSLMVLALLFGAIGIVLLFSPIRVDGMIGPVALWFGAVFLFTFLWSRFVSQRRRARRIFRQQKALQRPIEMDWSGDTLKVITETGNNAMPWSDLLKWRENKRMFLPYLSEVMFYIVPKRAFPDEAAIDAFRKMLREKIST